ncbi:MAG: Flagellar hook-associated protein 1 [Verrucomicrobiota bacterium]|jgi:flagellar hook-associated protein 1 FlgK
MGGLLNTLEIASSSLLASRAGIETAGVNISNVNNPGYARQRVIVEPRRDPTGAGTGVEVVGVKSLRDDILDEQLIRESSNSEYLKNFQRTLQIGQVLLGQQIDRQSATPEADAAARDLGGQMALASGFSEFYNALQAVTVSPGSTPDRQVLLLKAGQLTDKFNSVEERFTTLRSDLNKDLTNRIKDANNLIQLTSRAAMDNTVASSSGGGIAKDTLQMRLEELGGYSSIQIQYDDLERITVSINGVNVITDNLVNGVVEGELDEAGGLQVSVRNTDSDSTAKLTGQGSIQGLVDARDTILEDLRKDINLMASNLIEGMNAIHKLGKNLDGTGGLDFFSGSDASDIAINSELLADVRKIQLSADTDKGDNTIAVNLLKWLDAPQDSLGKLTVSQHYNEAVATYGQELANINNRLADQEVISHTLTQQRAAVSGVSLDEEMSSLIQFQRAYQSSAKLISTVNELFQTILAM